MKLIKKGNFSPKGKKSEKPYCTMSVKINPVMPQITGKPISYNEKVVGRIIECNADGNILLEIDKNSEYYKLLSIGTNQNFSMAAINNNLDFIVKEADLIAGVKK